MKYPKYSFTICIVICLLVSQVVQTYAQISEGGIPPSFRYETTLRSALSTLEIPVTFNVADLIHIDEWQMSEGLTPPCIATSIDVNLNPENAGQWSKLPSGEKIWQLQLQAKGAIALILYYADFYIPEGGKLYIYNTEKTQILGAYTHYTNPQGGRFATEMVAGDELTLEYVAGTNIDTPRINIESVGYGYNHITVKNNSISLRRAAAYCEVNINCEEGDAWQNQKKGVCAMTQVIGSGTYICSGSLVNNTAEDLKPYILSATHCNSNSAREATPEEMKQWTFYFHKEHEGCSNSSKTVIPKTMVGCKKIASTATNGQSDGLLLLLNSPVPEHYNVYYNGWDRRDQPAKSGVGIHHPQGDQKKISTFKKPVTHVTFSSPEGISGDKSAHWNAVFDATTNGHGVTEGGSSGSPLFNENKLIVGTLTGGSSSCSNPTGLNLYGKMGYHWNKYTQYDNTRMDKWLDPINAGVEILEGRYADITNIYPPTNFTAAYQKDKTVVLTWDKPLIGEPVKYNIYNNNLKINETTGLSYIDENPKTGTQLYSVSCTYADGSESNFVNTSVLIDEFKAPINVTATYTLQQKVAITWDIPLYEQTIYWGESDAMYQIAMDEPNFYFGQKWTKNEISDFHKKKLKAVKFVPIRNNTYEVYISQGDRVYTQKITNLTYTKTNTIELTTPFVIDATKDLIVAFYVAEQLQPSNSNYYPAVSDRGPAIQGKGNIWSYDAKQWKTLYNEEAKPGEFDYNFFVAAVVTSEEGEIPGSVRTTGESTTLSTAEIPNLKAAEIAVSTEPITFKSLSPASFPEVTGYAIYRDGQKIATVNPTPRRYIDNEPNKKTEYQVAAIYYNEYDGELSEAVFIDPLTNELIGKESPVLYPTVFSNQVEIKGLYQVNSIDIYDAKGKLYMHIDKPDNIINTQSLHPGIYFFRVHTSNGKDCTLRGIKNRR